MAYSSLCLQLRTLSQWFVLLSSIVLVLSFPFTHRIVTLSLWIFCISVITSFLAHRQIRFNVILLLPFTYFLSRLLSFFVNSKLTFSDIELSFSFLAIGITFLFFQTTIREINILLKAMLYFYLGISFWVLFHFILTVIPQELFLEALRQPKYYYPQFLLPPINTHPSFLAIPLSFSIPAAYYLRHSNTSINGFFFSLIIGTVPLTSYLIGSRIGIVVNILLIAFCSIYYIKKTSILNKILSIILATSVFLLSFFSNMDIKSDPIRSNLRNKAISVIKEHPWTGTGVNSMSVHLREIRDQLGGQDLNHFHSQLLDECVQFGVLGGLVFGMFFVWILYQAFNKKDFWLFIFLIVYIPFMIVEAPLRSVMGAIPFLFWMLWIFYTQENRLSTQQK